MEKNKWKKLQKGTGIIVCIPGDEHNGIQSKRPGIVVKTHENYVTVQLFSSQPSEHDLLTIVVNNKKQHLRPIYLKNILFNQINNYWFDYSKREPLSVNENSKLMKIIESNKNISNYITLELNDYLDLKKKNQHFEKLLDWNKELEQENEIQQLKKEIELLKNSNLKNRNRG